MQLLLQDKTIIKIKRLFKIFSVFLLVITSALLLSLPGYATEGYGLLEGFWQCQEEGVQTTLEFQSKYQLIYNGQPANYQLLSNTLSNLYLKPDGTYQESYEAGYGGQFQDQGGYQTGHWGATGTDQGQGRWAIQGTLKHGTLTLIASNGNRTVHQYRVHYKNGEYYWGEYFFNGKLYSVKYIYR